MESSELDCDRDSNSLSLGSFLLKLVCHGPNYMIYPGAFDPQPRNVTLPSSLNLPYEDITVTASDSVKVKAYLLLQPDAEHKLSHDILIYDNRPTILMFHGNSTDIGCTLPLAEVFFKRMRCNVLMLSPRGYGLSQGRPSAKGVKRDAEACTQAALRFLLSDSRLSHSPIILYGQSLGGAVAIDLASRFPDRVTALIVENTFTSLNEIIHDLTPLFRPCAPFFRQWNSRKAIRTLPKSIPILMLSGSEDEVIPPAHMKALWAEAGCDDPVRPESRSKVSGQSRGKSCGRNMRDHSGKTDDEEESGCWGKVTKVTSSLLEGKDKATRVGKRAVAGRREGRFVEFKEGTHSDTWDQPGYWDAVTEFIVGLPCDSGVYMRGSREKR